MGHFMSDQMETRRRVGCVFPGIEDDVSISSESPRLEGTSRFAGGGTRMNPNVAQVLAKSRLKEIASALGERLAALFGSGDLML